MEDPAGILQSREEDGPAERSRMRPLRLDAEQRSEIEPLRELSLGGLHERARRRRSLLSLGVAPLIEGERRSDDRQPQEDGERGGDVQQPPLAPPRPFELTHLRRAARIEKLAFRRRKCGLSLLRPLLRSVQPGAAIELAGIALEPEPFLRVVGETAVDLQALAVLVEPAPEQRPLTDQRFVRDLDRVEPNRHEAGTREDVEDFLDCVLFLAAGKQLAEACAPTSVFRSSSRFRKPEEDPLRNLLLLRFESLVDGVRGSGNRTAHASGLDIRLHAHRVVLTAGPRLEERVP